MRKIFAAAAICGLALAALGSAQLTFAHSRPIRFDPEPGAILNSAPSSITGWFTSDLRSSDNSFIQVLDESGQNVDDGDTQLSADRRQMSVGVQAGLSGGRYLVYWSTDDDEDGEVFSACHYIFVGQAAAEAAVADGVALDGGADCPGGEEEVESTASVAISVEASGNDATVSITPTDFTPRAPDGSTVDPNFGHYHIYLDKIPTEQIAGAGHSHSDEEMDMADSSETPMADDDEMDMGSEDDINGLAENPVMWVENSYTFKDLQPGVHTVAVALNHDDHTPFSPPVIASANFVIGGAGNGDDGGSDVPLWTLFVTGGLAAVGLVTGAYVLTRRAA